MRNLEIALESLIASSRNITKNKMKHPKEIVLKTEANSSNLDLTNQCWYKPAKVKITAQ